MAEKRTGSMARRLSVLSHFDRIKLVSQVSETLAQQCNIGALIVRIEFWGPCYYHYNKDPTLPPPKKKKL